MCAQPVGDREELVEDECLLSATTISALLPVRAPEESCMWSTGLCASWEGASLRVVLGRFRSPAVKRATWHYLLFQPLASTRSLAMKLDRLVGCEPMKGRVIYLLPHTKVLVM